MQLIEREIPGRALTVIRIVEHEASVMLELHHAYYTYYWRCLFGPGEFVSRMQGRAVYRVWLTHVASVTVAVHLGFVSNGREVPQAQAIQARSPTLVGVNYDERKARSESSP